MNNLGGESSDACSVWPTVESHASTAQNTLLCGGATTGRGDGESCVFLLRLSRPQIFLLTSLLNTLFN